MLEYEIKDIIMDRFKLFDPQKYGNCKDPTINVVNMDKALINLSDIILANVTELSCGTSQEILFANSLHKLVITVCPKQLLNPWHSAHSSHVFETLEEAIKKVVFYEETFNE